MSTYTQAYNNHGRWIADCIRPYCANAETLRSGQQDAVCSNCGYYMRVEWPTDIELIQAALVVRPVPNTRNWAPAGHRQALLTGFPNGQSVKQLLAENRDYGVN
jgi:hypothetical protein